MPLLTKRQIRDRREDLIAGDRPRGYTQTAYTSGSTGEPLSVLTDAWEMSAHLANQLRGRSWYGLKVGDPELRIWQDPRASVGLSARALRTANAVKDRLLNVRLVSAGDLSAAALARWERILRRKRPALIYGYASGIAHLARFLKERGGEVPDPKAVILTGEKITASQRELIAQVFGTNVVDEYGSVECGVLAFECPAGTLHTSDESAVLEVVDPDGDGIGELVVTSLRNYAMPLIRYRIGDLAMLSDDACPCGRTLGALTVVGRSADIFVGPDGRAAHPFRLTHVLHRLPKLIGYQVVQRSPSLIELVAEADSPLEETELESIRDAIEEMLGPGVELRIRYVDSIPRGPGGKHRFLVNLTSS